jgi:hypothetical protein
MKRTVNGNERFSFLFQVGVVLVVVVLVVVVVVVVTHWMSISVDLVAVKASRSGENTVVINEINFLVSVRIDATLHTDRLLGTPKHELDFFVDYIKIISTLYWLVLVKVKVKVKVNLVSIAGTNHYRIFIPPYLQR